MAMSRPSNNEVTSEDDMEFFRTFLKYTSKMSRYNNFNFRIDVMAKVREYVFKRQEKLKTNSMMMSKNDQALQMKRERNSSDEACGEPQKKKITLLNLKPIIRAEVDLTQEPEADTVHVANPAISRRVINVVQGNNAKDASQVDSKVIEKLTLSAMADAKPSGITQTEVSEIIDQVMKQIKKENLERQSKNPLAAAFAKAHLGKESELVDISDSDSDEDNA